MPSSLNPKYRRTKSGKINDRHRLVVDSYIGNGGDKFKAMEDNGYSMDPKSGNVHTVFARPDVTAEIDRRLAAMADKVDISVGWVLERLKRQATAGERMAKYRRVQLDGSIAWDFTNAPDEDLALIHDMTVDTYMEGRGLEAHPVKKFKITLPDPKGALDSLARYLGMFKDRVDVGVADSLADLIARGRTRVKADE